MQANPDKYNFLLTGKNELTLNINHTQIKSSKEEKLLGITIDNKKPKRPENSQLLRKT